MNETPEMKNTKRKTKKQDKYGTKQPEYRSLFPTEGPIAPPPRLTDLPPTALTVHEKHFRPLSRDL